MKFLLSVFLLTPSLLLFSQRKPIVTLTSEQKLSRRYADSAHLCAINNDTDLAIGFATSAIRLDRTNPYPYITRAAAYNRKKEHTAALEDFTVYLTYRPNDPLAYQYRADTFIDLEDFANAFKDYDKALSLEKAPDELAFIYYRRALLRVKLLDWTGGLDDCNKSIQHNKTDHYIYTLRAEINIENKKYKDVINDCNTAIQISEGTSTFHNYYFRGIAKVKLGDVESACTDLYRAKQMTIDYRVNRAIEIYCK